MFAIITMANAIAPSSTVRDALKRWSAASVQVRYMPVHSIFIPLQGASIDICCPFQSSVAPSRKTAKPFSRKSIEATSPTTYAQGISEIEVQRGNQRDREQEQARDGQRAAGCAQRGHRNQRMDQWRYERERRCVDQHQRNRQAPSSLGSISPEQCNCGNETQQGPRIT
jgi:hypothetical protein